MNRQQLRSWLAHHREVAYGMIFICSCAIGGSVGILLAPLFGR